MHKVNKILILFLAVMTISFIGSWQFLQSNSFAIFLSKSITEYTKKTIGGDIKFSKVDFKFFPPGAQIKNVEFKLLKNESEISLNLNSVGIFFSIMDSFKTKLTVKKVEFEDGKVTLNQKSSDADQKDIKDLDVKKIIQDSFVLLNKSVPLKIREITFLNILFELDNNSLFLNDSSFKLSQNELYSKINISQFNITHEFFNEDIIDQINLEFLMTQKNVQILNLELIRKLGKLTSNGILDFEDQFFDSRLKLNSKVLFDVSDVHDFVDLNSIGKLSAGLARLNCNSLGRIRDLETSCMIDIENLDSSFVYAENLKVDFKINNQNISIKDLDLKEQDQSLKILAPFVLYDFKTKRFIDETVKLKAKSFKLDNALKYLNESLYPLKGALSGEIDFILGENDFHFIINSPLNIENLKVQANPASAHILALQNLKIDKGSFDVIGKDFKMNILASVNETSFEANGFVGDGKLLFEVNNGYFDLTEFDKFAGLDIFGKGTISLKVFGPFNDIRLDLDTDIKSFFIQGYSLDRLLGQLRFDLTSSTIIFKNVNALAGTSTLSGSGTLNYDTLDVDVVAEHEKLNFVDLVKIYDPLLGNFNKYNNDVFGQYSATVSITGKATVDDLVVNSKFKGINAYFFGESIDKLNFEFELINKQLLFNNIELFKGKGKIFAATIIDLNTSLIKVNGNIFNISLQEIQNYSKLPIDLEANLNASFQFDYKNSFEYIQLQSYLNKSKVSERRLEDSFFSINYMKDIIKIEGNIFGNSINFDSNLNLSEKADDERYLSQLNVSTEIKDLALILATLRGVEVADDKVVSDIKLRSNLKFNINNIKEATGNLLVEKFLFKKGGINVEYLNDSDNITVIKGKINKWSLDIKGDKFYLISNAEGNFANYYDVSTKVKIDASIAEVFNKLVSKASGELLGQHRSFKNKNFNKTELYFLSNNLSLTTSFLPTAITDSDIRIAYKQNKLIFEKFNADLSKGNLKINGDINFNRIIPQVNLRYLIKDAGITVFDKSTILISGKGSLIGENVPYTLTGELLVNKANIINELNDFGSAESIIKQDIKYLPLSKQNLGNQFLNFNISLNTTEPIRVVNSRIDLGLDGALQITGGEKSPKLAGKISLASTSNKIYFQNNEYKITKGNIFFYENDLPSNPELDFVATSNIANNVIDIRVYGRLSDYKINLSSEPSMSQENILSLIAFGYSEDLSADLSETEKESITRAGVGSILFDSFKINETLKNEFGLQIDLGTQISKEEGSYLTYRNSEGTSSVGRVRSATTIEIKKKINDAMSLSMTSTVGSSSGQRQIMNLNYNINKTYSLEGVFEKRTAVEGDQDNVDNSFGADLKMKWSFK